MAKVLSLQATPFALSPYPIDSPEKSLMSGYAEVFRRKLTRLLSERKFRGDDVVPAMTTSVRTEAQAALHQSIFGAYGESHWRGEDVDTPLLRLITGKNGLEETESLNLSDVEISDQYLGAVEEGVGSYNDDFDVLEKIHKRTLKKTGVPQLLSEVLEASDHFKEKGADEIYHLIRSHIGDARFSLPQKQASDLYFITHLPTLVRFPTQDLLICQTQANCVESLKKKFKGEKEGEFIDALARYYRLNIFFNSHWDKMFDWYGVSQEVIDELSREQSERMVTLAKLQELLPLERNKDIAAAHFKNWGELDEQVQQLDEKSGSKRWMTTDIGHCFKGFGDQDLYIVLTNRDIAHEPTKNGRLAVILEDDNHQANTWSNVIQKHSPYTLPDGNDGRCETPTEIERFLDDDSVGYFLLDIQNGEDLMAGIRVAEDILRRKVLKYVAIPEDKRRERGGELKIVVWSNSRQSVQTAKQTLEALVEELDPKRRLISGFSTFCGSNPIEISVKMKSEKPFRFPYNRDRK
jgi:hypothetical protein